MPTLVELEVLQQHAATRRAANVRRDGRYGESSTLDVRYRYRLDSGARIAKAGTPNPRTGSACVGGAQSCLVPGPATIEERFTGGRLDETVWTPAYLPAWSSTREAAATYEVVGEGLRLTIPAEQPLWCPDLHDEPLRVSAIQSGTWSGPLGSTRGQQPSRDGLVVREPQEARWGFTPHYGHVEVECRASLTERSMFSAWMVGLEVDPTTAVRSASLRFSATRLPAVLSRRSATESSASAIRDCGRTFVAQPRPIDITEPHVYAVEWRQDKVDFLLDGERPRTVSQAPTYPMQLIIGVFDFRAAQRPKATIFRHRHSSCVA